MRSKIRASDTVLDSIARHKGDVKNENKIKKFERRIETILMTPHNPGFCSIPEMTDFGLGGRGGTLTLQRGPG